MSYYIYENWQAGRHKAVIHVGNCRFCHDGKGRAGGYDPRHAKWLGPYGTVQLARAASSGLPGVVVQREHCCVG
jgi:hypothetical protein